MFKTANNWQENIFELFEAEHEKCFITSGPVCAMMWLNSKTIQNTPGTVVDALSINKH